MKKIILSYVKNFFRNPYIVTADDYDAQKYWDDRHKMYGHKSLLGVGNNAQSEDENRAWYEAARYIFLGILNDLHVSTKAKILEIGYGSGFYSGIISAYGCSNYRGVDISDVHVHELEIIYPDYLGKFIKKDVGQEKIVFPDCDLIFMIDVSQHIVNDEKMRFCLINNVKSNLKFGGVFIVTDELKNKKFSYYEKSRTIEFYSEALNMKIYHKPIRFRDKYIFSFMHK